jgi:hypothetical protein
MTVYTATTSALVSIKLTECEFAGLLFLNCVFSGFMTLESSQGHQWLQHYKAINCCSSDVGHKASSRPVPKATLTPATATSGMGVQMYA